MDKNINKPKVSVLMPAYNAGSYLREAMQSALHQTLKNLELIVVNDGSSDNTEQVAKSFNDSRIRYIRNEKNVGLGPVRNQLLALARGEYIAWLDADDIALPERLRTQAYFLDTHPEFAMVGTWVELIDENGKKSGVEWKNRTTPEDMRTALFFGNQFTQSSVMIRKSDLPSPIYRGEYAPAEEYDLWIRMVEKKQMGTVPRILTQYRVLPKSASHGHNKHEVAREKIIIDNLARLGIKPTDEEYVLHRTNFDYTGEVQPFLTKREAWLLKLIEINKKQKVFDENSFEKIAGERWLASCRANSKGMRTWKQCWHSPLAAYISWKERWRDIFKFGINSLFRLG